MLKLTTFRDLRIKKGFILAAKLLHSPCFSWSMRKSLWKSVKLNQRFRKCVKRVCEKKNLSSTFQYKKSHLIIMSMLHVLPLVPPLTEGTSVGLREHLCALILWWYILKRPHDISILCLICYCSFYFRILYDDDDDYYYKWLKFGVVQTCVSCVSHVFEREISQNSILEIQKTLFQTKSIY